MSEETTPDIRTKRAVPFKTSTFGGYVREEVDAYVDEVAKAAERDTFEMSLLKQKITELEGQLVAHIPTEAEVTRLQAQVEALQQDEAVRMGQLLSEANELREQLRAQRDELERSQIDLAKLGEEIEALRVERDSFQRLAERLSSEEQQAKELLLAATKAAEELRHKARRDAEDISRRTEESVARMEEEARQRVEELRKEYERIRIEYDAFLVQGREVAQNLVRKMDDARAKWPL